MNDIKFEKKAKELSASIIKAMNNKKLRKGRYENKIKSMNAIKNKW